MTKARMEAFSDGVIAILITIMVLELGAPEGEDWGALASLVPALLTYLLSFVMLGIYWNNHHHLLHLTRRVNGKILWANLHVLLWLSLIPFATGWLSETHLARVPTAVYGIVLILSAAAWLVLQAAIIADQGPESPLAAAVQRDVKGKVSFALYALAIPLALVRPALATALYVIVALMWLVPDRRIEAVLSRSAE